MGLLKELVVLRAGLIASWRSGIEIHKCKQTQPVASVCIYVRLFKIYIRNINILSIIKAQ